MVTVQHWLHEGETSTDNLVLLCTHHHHLVHEGGWSGERGEHDAWLFVAPDGARVEAAVRPAITGDTLTWLREWADERVLDLGPDANLPLWDGTRPDYDVASPIRPAISDRSRMKTVAETLPHRLPSRRGLRPKNGTCARRASGESASAHLPVLRGRKRCAGSRDQVAVEAAGPASLRRNETCVRPPLFLELEETAQLLGV